MSEETPVARFTPESAERYVIKTMPGLLQEAAIHLGEPYPDGSLDPDPRGRIARLAIQSADEILVELWPHLSEDTRVTRRAELARLAALFREKFPGIDLMRQEGPAEVPEQPVSDLTGLVADAWAKLEKKAD